MPKTTPSRSSDSDASAPEVEKVARREQGGVRKAKDLKALKPKPKCPHAVDGTYTFVEVALSEYDTLTRRHVHTKLHDGTGWKDTIVFNGGLYEELSAALVYEYDMSDEDAYRVNEALQTHDLDED